MGWNRTGATLLILLLALAGWGPRDAAAQGDERCFAETGYCISGPIRSFWEANGGLAVFGLPLSPQQAYEVEAGHSVQAQWFERHRLELHPENDPPYNVLLGRLGVDRLSQQGRDWRTFPPLNPDDADAEACRFFSETNHQVCGQFLQAFRAYGLSFPGTPGITFEESLALFGLPLSEPQTEVIDGKELTVQWFERARFELHPENDPPYNVLFGRLGAELSGGPAQPGGQALQQAEWRLVSFGAIDAPEPAVGDRPATLRFDGERVSGFTGCNTFQGPYQASESTISFGQLISTLAACIDEAITRQERAILSALQGEVAYRLSDGELVLPYDEGRQQLTYRAAPAAAVRGTVTYRERIALPPQAQIQVQLVDVSRADAPAIVLASVTIEAAGRQVPFPFELAYDPATIDERNSYAVQARITIDGELRFISTSAYPVITQGHPTTVEVIVNAV